jgi:hypothetical protein
MADVISLEIHHVSMGGGDCTAIVVRWTDDPNNNNAPVQVARVLVDAGGETADDGHLAIARYLAKEIQGLKDGPWELAIASHYHADHIAGFQRCGIDFLRLVDLGGYALGNETWTGVNPLGNLAEISGPLASYAVQVTKVFEKGGRSRVELPFMKAENFDSQGKLASGAGPVVIPIVPGLPVTLTVYCAGGVLADGTNVLLANVSERVLRKRGIDPLQPTFPGASSEVKIEDEIEAARQKVSPNDSSIAFILQWGDFRYFSAGDLSGDLSLTRYANVEEPLMAYLDALGVLAKPVDVMKATHHGSNHNNYPPMVYRKANWNLAGAGEADDQGADPSGGVAFYSADGKGLLDRLKPETILVPCNQMKCVPGSEYVGRVRAYCSVGQKDRLLTVNFINRCDYPRPSSPLYDERQKASWPDFNSLRAAVGATLLMDDADGITNGPPRVAVVHVPPLPSDTVTSDDVTVIRKMSHSLKLDFGVLDNSNASLASRSQGQQLPPLSQDQFKHLAGQLMDRAQEIVALAASSPGYVRKRFPALATIGTADEVLGTLTALVNKSYPPPSDQDLFYTPQNKRLSAYERTTVYSLQRNTPDLRDAAASVIGTLGYDAEILEYWKRQGKNPDQVAFDGTPPRLGVRKRKPTRDDD